MSYLRKLYTRLVLKLREIRKLITCFKKHISFLQIGHFSSLSGILPPMSGILQLNWDGEIVATYFNTDKSIGRVSDAIVYNDKLYIGSPHSSYIGSVAVPPLIKNAFSKTRAGVDNNAEVKKTQPKVESAPTAKIVQKSETEKVKVAEKIDIPKPPVQKTKEPVPVQKPLEKQANVGNQQIKKESSKTEKDDVKVNKQETVTKPKPVEPKPIKQETASMPKPVETKPIKEETKPKKVETKPIKEESKPKIVETKPKKETDAKPKPVESKPIQQESVTKPKTVKKESINQESKTVPVEPKSAPKKQTVPPKGTENVNTKTEPKTGQSKETPSKKPKTDAKQNVVQQEPVKAAKVEKPEGKKQPSQSTDKDKIKVVTPNGPKKPVPDQIPVKEEIPSDRVQPPKEPLKVIKKSGPVEIPNPV